MGRPLTDFIFGHPNGAGTQIAISECWIPGEGSANATSYVVRQNNPTSFLACNAATGRTGLVSLALAADAAGKARIAVLPFAPGSGATAACRLGAISLSLVAGGSGYSVNDTLTLVGGTSTVAVVATVSTIDGGGAVTAVSLNTAGSYSALPGTGASTTTSGGGTGAKLTVPAWKIVSIIVTAGGSGYTTAQVVLPGSATATASVSAGSITAIAVGTAGSYSSIPSVTIQARGPAETLRRISSKKLLTHQGNTYLWRTDGTIPGIGYATLPLA